MALHLEILALRHQLAVVNGTRRSRLRLTSTGRMLWAWLSRTWHGWRMLTPTPVAGSPFTYLVTGDLSAVFLDQTPD